MEILLRTQSALSDLSENPLYLTNISSNFRVDDQISNILDICRTDDGKASVKIFYDVSYHFIKKCHNGTKNFVTTYAHT